MLAATIERRAFNAKEAAQLLGLSETVVLRLIRERRLHSARAGRRHLISQHAIDDFLNSSTNDQQRVCAKT